MKRFFITFIMLICVQVSNGQYWSDFVLEKGFSSRDYFLQPHPTVWGNSQHIGFQCRKLHYCSVGGLFY